MCLAQGPQRSDAGDCPRLFKEKRRDLVFASQSPYRSRYLAGATPPTALYRFFRNFTGVLVMV